METPNVVLCRWAELCRLLSITTFIRLIFSGIQTVFGSLFLLSLMKSFQSSQPIFKYHNKKTPVNSDECLNGCVSYDTPACKNYCFGSVHMILKNPLLRYYWMLMGVEHGRQHPYDFPSTQRFLCFSQLQESVCLNGRHIITSCF